MAALLKLGIHLKRRLMADWRRSGPVGELALSTHLGHSTFMVTWRRYREKRTFRRSSPDITDLTISIEVCSEA
jgi:hypothetical protein